MRRSPTGAATPSCGGLVGFAAVMVIVTAFATAPSATAQETRAGEERSSEELASEKLALETASAIVGVFDDIGDGVWPGYDLAARPLAIYVPDVWMLLLNVADPLEGFEPYPVAWPPLPGTAQVYRGRYGGLAGELAFDVEVANLRTVAIPVAAELVPPGLLRPRLHFFTFAVHEAFHQFQHDAFRSVETQPEEHYPIVDADNTALAVLEMRLLVDALGAKDPASLRSAATAWVALRRHRWDRAQSFVREFESKIERLEGLCRDAKRSELLGAICAEAQALTVDGLLLAELHERLPGVTLAPEDVARNRVYPVAASLCVLLDRLGASWKGHAAQLDGDSSLVDLLEESLAKVPAGETQSVDELKRRYGFDTIVDATRDSIDAYVSAYKTAVAKFEAQTGYRIEVSVPKSGISRSRSSFGRKWVLDEGANVFGERFVIYSLKRRGANELSFEVHEIGVLEQMNKDRTRRIVTFISPALETLEIDGRVAEAKQDRTFTFNELLLVGDGFRLRSVGPGKIIVHGRAITVETS